MSLHNVTRVDGAMNNCPNYLNFNHFILRILIEFCLTAHRHYLVDRFAEGTTSQLLLPWLPQTLKPDCFLSVAACTQFVQVTTHVLLLS